MNHSGSPQTTVSSALTHRRAVSLLFIEPESTFNLGVGAAQT